jgi:hypothetical protein
VFNVRSHVVSISWLPTIAVAVWWAGFMPFPTSPYEIGQVDTSLEQELGAVHTSYREVVSADTARRMRMPYGLGSWACEKDGLPAGSGCKLVTVRSLPFYGLGKPRWLLSTFSTGAGANPVPVALKAFRSYAACQWQVERAQKEADADWVAYSRWATEHAQKVETSYSVFTCEAAPS